jgi:Ser/Thr protein kinase RdoA (MazF antagonist)
VAPELITRLEQITPEWLTRVLQRNQLLNGARVAEVTYESGVTCFCITAHLRISYTSETEAPQRLFLKFSKPIHPVTTAENGWEVRFYKFVAAHTPPLIPRCYDAVFSPELTRLHLLLEDFSGTHYGEPPSHLPPSKHHCEHIVRALADIHAAWWGRPPWDAIGFSQPDRAEVDRRITDVTKRVGLFTDFLGDRLSEKRRGIYQEVLAGLPDLYERLINPLSYTVIHEDTHIGNVLYPRDPATDTIRIIDWQTWNVDLAAKDLAHMMAMFWFPEQRKTLELPLLKQYHERLCQNGVNDYSWEQLWYDYRLSVIRKLFHPPWLWATGHEPNIWWNHLERVMSAYEDLECKELLTRR